MRIYDETNTTNASLQPFKYNGKELDMMHGLNTYDYGARQYYSVVPAWDRIDPLCEEDYSISPYAYCGNNPVNRLDPDGRDWYQDKNKNAMYFSEDDEIDKEKWTMIGNGRFSTSVNNANKTANNLIGAGLGKGAGKITGKLVSKTPTITKAGTNLSNNKISKTVKGLCPGISNKKANNIAKSIRPTTNRVMKGTKTVTDGIRRSSSKVSATTSGVVQGMVTNRDRK